MRSHEKKEIPTAALMEMIKLSDESALGILYDRLWERMYALAYLLLKDKDRSKDIVQDVWISIWERRATIKNDNVEGYILQATRFRVYKELRDSKFQRIPLELLQHIKASESNGILDTLYLQDTETILERSIEGLPKKCHQVFVLSRYVGLENAEISKKLGISQRTVETHISNAIRRIKSEIIFPLILLMAAFS
ncbi:MAG: sigma-70 family RNA polymerase sigma factor [Sediminicola sp.]